MTDDGCEKERSHRPCHASCIFPPSRLALRSRLALFEEFVLAVVLVDTLYCYVKTRNMCIYICICNVWNSGTESYKRADRGRNSDAEDNVEEFTFRSWYIVSNKIESRFCQILPPRVRCFFSFLFYFYVRQSLAIIQSRRVWTAVNHVTN